MSGTKDGPFKGLAPFEEEDAWAFFGRDKDGRLLTANALTNPITVAYGPSGVGKSSLVNAGLIPHLRARETAHIEVLRDWVDNPLPAIEKLLGREPSSATARRLILVLDQFEEFFLYHSDPEPLGRMLASLLASRSANLVIVLREDGLSKLDAFEPWILGLFDNLFRIEPLNRAAAEQAIRGPIERINVDVVPEETLSIEDLAVACVLDELEALGAGQGLLEDDGRGPRRIAAGIETTYLQLILKRLWQQDIETYHSYRLKHSTLVETLGGPKAIVRRHLDETLRNLPPATQGTCAALMRFIVSPGGTKIALRVSELSAYAEVPEENARAALNDLAKLRILRVRRGDGAAADDGTYELFHDALVQPVLAWRRRFDQQRQQRHLTRERRSSQLKWLLALCSILAVAAMFSWNRAAKADREAKRANEAASSARDFAVQATSEREKAIEATQRLLENVAFRQNVFGASPEKIRDLLQSKKAEDGIGFKVAEQRTRHRTEVGGPVFQYSITAVLPPGKPPVGTITYYFDHSSFKAPFIATGPAQRFTARWDGVNCVRSVYAIIEYVPRADDRDPIRIAKFDQCELLREGRKATDGPEGTTGKG